MKDEIRRATGSQYCYAYVELPVKATLQQIVTYCSSTRRIFSPIADSMSDLENSRWVLRHYLALKLISGASLLAGSAIYAFERNLLLGVPYFTYYAVLNSCRAFLLTCPQVSWDGEKTVGMTHRKILNMTADCMRALDPARRELWRRELAFLKERREAFSYRFPLSGPKFVGRSTLDPTSALSLARLLSELASLNTEFFEGELSKRWKDDFQVLELPDHELAMAYALSGELEVDRDDAYRFGKLVDKWGTVSTLEVMTSDGLIDDVYGAWFDSEQDDDEGFDPDSCASLLLFL